MRLLEQTQRLLGKCQLNDRQIAEGAGLGVKGTNWVNKVRRRAIANPGIRKVESLHDFLSSHVVSSSIPSGSRTVAKAATRKQSVVNRCTPDSRVRKSPIRASGNA